MITPAQIPDHDLGRIVYLCAGAISTALRARGADDSRLYPDHPTPLALWAGLNRGHLLALLNLMVGAIRASDARRGVTTQRGHVRFRAARACAQSAVSWAQIVPVGTITSDPPLEIRRKP